MERLSLLPDVRFASLLPTLEEQVRRAADSLDEQTFADLFDPLMRETLRLGLAAADAHEGTVWLVDQSRTHLVAAFNSGPNAAQIVGVYRQPLSRGLISMVYASGHPFCESRIYEDDRQDRTLDGKLGVRTCAMIAVPLRLMQRVRGVVSCVQLGPADESAPDPPGFSDAHLRCVEVATSAVARLLGHRLLAATLGWEVW